MLGKLCGGGDTPWVTLKCIFINRSPNVTVDHTDGAGGDEKEEENFETKSCCCFQWLRRRPQNENELTTTTLMSNENVKETTV
jgi:hypothetical protein